MSQSGQDGTDTPIQKMLDEAARAYMEGEYDDAVENWQKVLSVEPGNNRARQGLKKVHMLHAEDTPSMENEGPVLDQVQALMKERKFQQALDLCSSVSEQASADFRAKLEQLAHRAGKAQAIEPEIKRCLANARRELQEGHAREALPHLKQVLALDRHHPLAVKLMDAIRQRVQKKRDARAGSSSARNRSAHAPDQHADSPLPATGQPGSDAAPFSLDSLPDPAAPPGRGLPSSPVDFDGDNASMPEIELEIQTPSATDGMIALDDEVIGEDFDIKLQPTDEAALLRPAQAGQTESPFETPLPSASQPLQVPDAGEDGDDPSAEMDAPLDAPGDLNELFAPEPDPGPPPSTAARGSKKTLFLGLAVFLVAAGTAAWWFGLIPGLSSPESAPESPPVRTAREAAAQPQPVPPAVTEEPAAGEPPAAAAGETSGAATAQAGGQTPPAPEPPARDPREALVLFEKGQDLFDSGNFEEAAKTFDRAMLLDPVNSEIAVWQSRVTSRLEQERSVAAERAKAVDAFESKDFESALRLFYRLQEKDSEGSYKGYIANSWYNWGLQLLAAGNLREADRKMDESLQLRPGDSEALAVKKLVGDYARRAKDKAFFLRIQALRYRPIDA